MDDVSVPNRQSQSKLFSLPSELRNLVYGYYLTAPGGYHYRYETNRLTEMDGTLIDLEFLYTCKFAAAEMHGLIFTLNTVKFSTFYNEATSDHAGQYHYMQLRDEGSRSRLLRAFRGCIDQDSCNKLEADFPQFLPVIRQLHGMGVISVDGLADDSWGEAPSLYRRFVIRALEALLEDADWNMEGSNHKTIEVVSLQHSPWLIPDSNEIADIRRSLQHNLHLLQSLQRTKYSFSAASAAIRFFSSMPASIRCRFRRVLLDENHVAAAWPECHVQGLLPYCQENGALRIERRVDLWRNALPAGASRMNGFYCGQGRLRPLRAEYITRSCLAPWIMEALALDDLGMPPQCFKLVFNGQPIPARSAEVFKIVQRDAAWQTVFEEHRADHHNKMSWFETRRNAGYQMRGFPEALAAIADDTSIVSCNFSLASFDYSSSIRQAAQGWSMKEWEEQWSKHEPRTFDAQAP